jgi:hypothetical protein
MLVAGTGLGLMAVGAVIVRWGVSVLQRNPTKGMGYRVILGTGMFALGAVLLVIGLVAALF